MKTWNYLLCIACMTITMQVHAEEYFQQDPTNANKVSTEESPQENNSLDAVTTSEEPAIQPVLENAIAFITLNEDYPTGEYIPAENSIIFGPHGPEIINSASAYIGEISYSEVAQEKNILPHQESHYLGYFINNAEEKVYLYGIKDTTTPNDAVEETLLTYIDTDNDTDDDDTADDDDTQDDDL